VTITVVSSGARSIGRMTIRSVPRPSPKAIERQAECDPLVHAVVLDQRPGDVGGEHRHLALGEVDHAGRPVDQHERERERREDRAGGEPCDDLLEELGHQWLLR